MLLEARALEVAAACRAGAAGDSSDDDSLPALGTHVSIRPDDYTTAAVEGTLLRITADDVAIRREAPDLGETVVHFPRIGYALKELA